MTNINMILPAIALLIYTFISNLANYPIIFQKKDINIYKY